jgi:hypothetical protein
MHVYWLDHGMFLFCVSSTIPYDGTMQANIMNHGQDNLISCHIMVPIQDMLQKYSADLPALESKQIFHVCRNDIL